jgi:hypothetical protein
VYATNLGLEHWKSEDAALPYASAVWSSYINNTKILDELQKYGGTPRKKPRFEAVTPLAKKLGASESKQLRSSEKRERAIDIGKKRAGHREALRGALWSSASSLQQTEANRKLVSMAKARGERHFNRIARREHVPGQETSVERKIRYYVKEREVEGNLPSTPRTWALRGWHARLLFHR